MLVIETNPESYRLAAERIASGKWTVDPDRGVILGSKGQPLSRINSWGYVQLKFRHPLDYRQEVAVLAHRVIWEHLHGTLPDGIGINHFNGVKTDNRLANLEAVTHSDNMFHAFRTGLNRPSRSNARLTSEQAKDVYRRCWAGESDYDLADEYGLKRSAINNIRHGWNWQWATGHRGGRNASPEVEHLG